MKKCSTKGYRKLAGGGGLDPTTSMAMTAAGNVGAGISFANSIIGALGSQVQADKYGRKSLGGNIGSRVQDLEGLGQIPMVGPAAQLIGGTIWGAIDHKRAAAKAKQLEYDDINGQLSQGRSMTAANMNADPTAYKGSRSVSYYAAGGPTAKPVGTGVELEGKSHEQGGIKLPGGKIEVEDGETMSADGHVFSKRLGFADRHKKLLRISEKLEGKPLTLDRQATKEVVAAKEMGLKVEQEMVKSQLGIQSPEETAMNLQTIQGNTPEAVEDRKVMAYGGPGRPKPFTIKQWNATPTPNVFAPSNPDAGWVVDDAEIKRASAALGGDATTEALLRANPQLLRTDSDVYNKVNPYVAPKVESRLERISRESGFSIDSIPKKTLAELHEESRRLGDAKLQNMNSSQPVDSGYNAGIESILKPHYRQPVATTQPIVTTPAAIATGGLVRGEGLTNNSFIPMPSLPRNPNVQVQRVAPNSRMMSLPAPNVDNAGPVPFTVDQFNRVSNSYDNRLELPVGTKQLAPIPVNRGRGSIRDVVPANGKPLPMVGNTMVRNNDVARTDLGKTPGEIAMDYSLPKLGVSNNVNLPTTLRTDFTTPSAPTFGQKVSTYGGNFMKSLPAAADKMTPYISNLANSFRTMPDVPKPTYDKPVTLAKYDMSAQEQEARRQGRSADMAADQTLDANSAAAARAANLTGKIRAINDVKGQEQNANTNVANQQAQMNAQIASRNNSKTDQYKANLVDREIAQSSFRQQNLVNVLDKAEMAKMDDKRETLDQQKFSIMADAFGGSGVAQRHTDRLFEQAAGDSKMAASYARTFPKEYAAWLKRKKG